MINSTKVTLREAQMEDAPFLFEMTQDEDYSKYFPSNLIATDLEDQKRKLRHYIAQMKNNNGAYFVILFGKEQAGIIDLYKIDKRNKRAGIGYGLAKEYRGKGITKKAVKEAIKYAKQKLKLHALESTAHPKNISSQKVLIHCGFKKVGVMKDYYFEKEKFEDRVLYWKILE